MIMTITITIMIIITTTTTTTTTIIIIIIIIIIINFREVYHWYFRENQPLGYTEHDIVRVAHNNSMVLHTMYMYITFRLKFLNLS